MHRLFVAIRPPAAIRGHLLDLTGGIPSARWQDDEQLHLTLRFIGEVDRHAAEDVAAVLGQIVHPPIEMALHGLGTFDRKGRIDTLWAGVTAHQPLTSLHNKIDQALRTIGIDPDRRAFLPHITIARFARLAADNPELQAFLAHNSGLSSERFTATHFTLFESSLTREGARYEAVARYPLAG